MRWNLITGSVIGFLVAAIARAVTHKPHL